MKFTKKLIRNFMKRTSEFEFKNVLFFVGIVLSIYLVAGCLLGTIHDSHARPYSVVLEHK